MQHMIKAVLYGNRIRTLCQKSKAVLLEEFPNVIAHGQRRNEPRDFCVCCSWDRDLRRDPMLHHRTVNNILHDTLEQFVPCHPSYERIDTRSPQ